MVLHSVIIIRGIPHNHRSLALGRDSVRLRLRLSKPWERHSQRQRPDHYGIVRSQRGPAFLQINCLGLFCMEFASPPFTTVRTFVLRAVSAVQVVVAYVA